MRGYQVYNKKELFNRINKIFIQRQGDQIVTKYDGRVLKVVNVSNRYEIFDIVKYLKDKINDIEKNFKINTYNLKIKGGVQQLELISDIVTIDGVEFYKSFYILNSSDKSRRLNFNVGLKSKKGGFYIVANHNASLVKKHLKGVTQAAEEASSFGIESFDEQIKDINSVVGHRISFSKMREVILDDNHDRDIPEINHRKFDVFKSKVRTNDKIRLNQSQHDMLMEKSLDMKSVNKKLDFDLDAFWCLQSYMSMFQNQDSHIVKKETNKIMNITKWSVRNSLLESLGI